MHDREGLRLSMGLLVYLTVSRDISVLLPAV